MYMILKGTFLLSVVAFISSIHSAPIQGSIFKRQAQTQGVCIEFGPQPRGIPWGDSRVVPAKPAIKCDKKAQGQAGQKNNQQQAGQQNNQQQVGQQNNQQQVGQQNNQQQAGQQNNQQQAGRQNNQQQAGQLSASGGIKMERCIEFGPQPRGIPWGDSRVVPAKPAIKCDKKAQGQAGQKNNQQQAGRQNNQQQLASMPSFAHLVNSNQMLASMPSFAHLVNANQMLASRPSFAHLANSNQKRDMTSVSDKTDDSALNAAQMDELDSITQGMQELFQAFQEIQTIQTKR